MVPVGILVPSFRDPDSHLLRKSVAFSCPAVWLGDGGGLLGEKGHGILRHSAYTAVVGLGSCFIFRLKQPRKQVTEVVDYALGLGLYVPLLA